MAAIPPSPAIPAPPPPVSFDTCVEFVLRGSFRPCYGLAIRSSHTPGSRQMGGPPTLSSLAQISASRFDFTLVNTGAVSAVLSNSHPVIRVVQTSRNAWKSPANGGGNEFPQASGLYCRRCSQTLACFRVEFTAIICPASPCKCNPQPHGINAHSLQRRANSGLPIPTPATTTPAIGHGNSESIPRTPGTDQNPQRRPRRRPVIQAASQIHARPLACPRRSPRSPAPSAIADQPTLFLLRWTPSRCRNSC